MTRYDPDDYHRQITCGNAKCTKTFGFWMFKVSERRETEVRGEGGGYPGVQVRIEVKKENEELAKKRAQQKRRNARADKRVEVSGGCGSCWIENVVAELLVLACRWRTGTRRGG